MGPQTQRQGPAVRLPQMCEARSPRSEVQVLCSGGDITRHVHFLLLDLSLPEEEALFLLSVAFEKAHTRHSTVLCTRQAEPVTLWFAGRHSVHWATPARATVLHTTAYGVQNRLNRTLPLSKWVKIENKDLVLFQYSYIY